MGMRMSKTTVTDPYLTLHQLFSPSFPIGAFAYSNGLEAAVEDGIVTSAQDLENWLTGLLLHGVGWSDAVFAAMSGRKGATDELVELAWALSTSAERRLETEKQGVAFVDTANALFGLSCRAAPYPVAVGAVVHAMNLPVREAIRLYLFSTVSNSVAAGMRLLPMGQTAGQNVIASLASLCTQQADEAMEAELKDLGGFSTVSDVAGMRHEILYSRIFRS